MSDHNHNQISSDNEQTTTPQQRQKTKKEKWDVMYANVRGLKSKILSLTEVLSEKNPHIFLIAETLLQANSGIQIKGYTFFGRKREGLQPWFDFNLLKDG